MPIASETDENIIDTLKNTHFSTLTPAKSTCCFVNVPKIWMQLQEWLSYNADIALGIMLPSFKHDYF